MEIKDENIDTLMEYFDKCRDEIEKALDNASEYQRQGFITHETLKDIERDALRLTYEHTKIRNILFGMEAR